MPHPDELLAGLDPEQRRVAEALRGPVRVLAGAGTGKTRAITHRIAHGVATGVYAPTEVLALTFTTRAAGELRSRLQTLGAPGVQARTFHSAALRQLRYFWPRHTGHELPQLIESKIGLMAATTRRQRVQADQALLRDLSSEIEWAKVSNVTPEQYAELAQSRGRDVAGHTPESVARLYAGYEETKRSQGRMDMEDVLLFTAGMLADDERVAATVRQQYKWFVVDEFQDVSPLQWALLQLWLGGREELCVVGDPAQTIYSFAGAQASYLLDFPRTYRNATNIELVRNYRSVPEIVEVANRLLAGTQSQSVTLTAQRASGPGVEFAPQPDEQAEAEAVADAVAEALAGGAAPSDVAVLYRINAASQPYEEALAARGIGYVLRGAARFFERPEVKQAVALLRAGARSGHTDGPADNLVGQVQATLSTMGWSSTPPEGRGQTRDRWESLQALVDLAVEHAGTEGQAALGLTDFVAELDRRAGDQHAPVADGVTLATLHAAKGLEWPVVLLAGMSDGLMPLVHATTPDEIEEERRLLYVGVTRARDRLVVSWANARHPGGRANRTPSRFLTSVLPSGIASEGSRKGRSTSPRGSHKARRCRSCGKPLETAAEKKVLRCAQCPITYCAALFESLRTWRRERAREDEVPAFVVFDDRTLEAVAEQRPQSTAALLKTPGIGPTKLERYGEDLVALVAAHGDCDRTCAPDQAG